MTGPKVSFLAENAAYGKNEIQLRQFREFVQAREKGSHASIPGIESDQTCPAPGAPPRGQTSAPKRRKRQTQAWRKNHPVLHARCQHPARPRCHAQAPPCPIGDKFICRLRSLEFGQCFGAGGWLSGLDLKIRIYSISQAVDWQIIDLQCSVLTYAQRGLIATDVCMKVEIGGRFWALFACLKNLPWIGQRRRSGGLGQCLLEGVHLMPAQRLQGMLLEISNFVMQRHKGRWLH